MGGWGGVNDVRCGLLTKVIMSCYEDKHCSTRHARASWFAKTDNVLRWITQGFKWGGWGGGVWGG